jgi:uncharacterized flavoprotein (TIGR03862 family)
MTGAMTQNQPESIDVAVVGGGPAGLMAAETAARAGLRVAIFDAMPSVGRKFLMAGRSGLNITHGEDFERFVSRYGAAAVWMRPMLEEFSPQAMREFCAGLGVETYVGSSGRVFPTVMKASPLLRAWLARLGGLGVVLRTRRRLAAINGSGVIEFAAPDGSRERVAAKALVLALGGASWPRLGSTGAWTQRLAEHGIAIAPFLPSNCGVEIGWSDVFLRRFEGQAIKTAGFSFHGRTVRGEAVVTKRGLEGGPVYALSNAIGEELRAAGAASLAIDLKPDTTVEALVAKLAKRRREDSLSNALRKTIGLPPLGIALLREFSGEISQDPAQLAGRIKRVAIPVRGVAGLERAISSAGGIVLGEVDDAFMLRKLPGVFVAGEMLDWDAPTGGYLLQACFAMGRRAGEGATKFARATIAGGVV